MHCVCIEPRGKPLPCVQLFPLKGLANRGLLDGAEQDGHRATLPVHERQRGRFQSVASLPAGAGVLDHLLAKP
jgi:hypothetical protein